MEEVWVRGRFDFGLPFKTFTVPLRSQVGQNVWQDYRQAVKDRTEQESITSLTDTLRAALAETRPELGDGLIVISLAISRHGGWIDFTAIHPSFPRVPFGHTEPRERLELCPVCKKPLAVYESYLTTVEKEAPRVITEVCSPACAGDSA